MSRISARKNELVNDEMKCLQATLCTTNTTLPNTTSQYIQNCLAFKLHSSPWLQWGMSASTSTQFVQNIYKLVLKTFYHNKKSSTINKNKKE